MSSCKMLIALRIKQKFSSEISCNYLLKQIKKIALCYFLRYSVANYIKYIIITNENLILEKVEVKLLQRFNQNEISQDFGDVFKRRGGLVSLQSIITNPLNLG